MVQTAKVPKSRTSGKVPMLTDNEDEGNTLPCCAKTNDHVPVTMVAFSRRPS